MTISVMSAARYLCDACDWKISNLELQKMLYIAQMLHLGATGKRLCDTTFEAWDYGPVSRELYGKVKAFGSNPIRDVFLGAPSVSDSLERDTLDAVARHFRSMSSAKLVAMTHWEKGAWYKNYQPGAKGIVIPDDDIIDEHRARSKS